MTEPTPTPGKPNSPEAPDSDKTRLNPDATGFFNRVRSKFKSEEEPVHPTEAAEIVIMDEE